VAHYRQGGAPFIVTLSGLPPFRGVGRLYRTENVIHWGLRDVADATARKNTRIGITMVVKKKRKGRGLIGFPAEYYELKTPYFDDYHPSVFIDLFVYYFLLLLHHEYNLSTFLET
jgi:hypothetical protein